MKLRAWMAIALAAVTLLQACGGGGGDTGSGSVRLVNATDDYASLDMYTSDGTTETQRTTGVTIDTAGAYVGLGAGTYTFNLKRTGSSTTSSTSSRTVVKDNSHTLVAYSTSGVLKSVFLTDNEVAPSATAAKLRVFNGSEEAGPVDVYVTDPGATLTASSPTASSLQAGRISAYTEIGAGTYRIRVTGAGDKTDLRLDLPSVALSNPQILTLVLTSTPGGVLVHARLINQKDTVAAERNTSARVRLVSGASAAGTATATINGTVFAGQASPVIGPYQLVPAGTLALSATLNGAAATLNNPPATLVAGSDNTLLVNGSGTNGTATLISDDNSPALISGNAKLRVIHGVGNLASPITLTADFSAVATNVPTNSGSTPVSVAANSSTTTTELDVTSPTGGTLFTKNAALSATRNYTVFMLGDASAPIGVLLRDR